jgi:hypothetical protein
MLVLVVVTIVVTRRQIWTLREPEVYPVAPSDHLRSFIAQRDYPAEARPRWRTKGCLSIVFLFCWYHLASMNVSFSLQFGSLDTPFPGHPPVAPAYAPCPSAGYYSPRCNNNSNEASPQLELEWPGEYLLLFLFWWNDLEKKNASIKGRVTTLVEKQASVQPHKSRSYRNRD